VEDAVLTDRDPYTEIQEQAGKPAAGGDAYGRDGDEQNERADEQEFIEPVDSQWPILPLALTCRIVLPAGDTSLPYLIFNISLPW
jgi:hypothetical protein